MTTPEQTTSTSAARTVTVTITPLDPPFDGDLKWRWRVDEWTGRTITKWGARVAIRRTLRGLRKWQRRNATERKVTL